MQLYNFFWWLFLEKRSTHLYVYVCVHLRGQLCQVVGSLLLPSCRFRDNFQVSRLASKAPVPINSLQYPFSAALVFILSDIQKLPKLDTSMIQYMECDTCASFLVGFLKSTTHKCYLQSPYCARVLCSFCWYLNEP